MKHVFLSSLRWTLCFSRCVGRLDFVLVNVCRWGNSLSLWVAAVVRHRSPFQAVFQTLRRRHHCHFQVPGMPLFVPLAFRLGGCGCRVLTCSPCAKARLRLRSDFHSPSVAVIESCFGNCFLDHETTVACLFDS